MKLKNIYLVLKDQMPLERFIRNFRKGHLYGIMSKRSHLTKDGTPKVGYKTKQTATRVANEMSEKKGTHFSNYKCLWCDEYHLGKKQRK